MSTLFRLLSIAIIFSFQSALAQIVERPRPAEWSQLVYGARFIDRFLPMPAGILSADTWGVQGVIPRYIDNGIENRTWSFWGGNILRSDDGKYHLFVCGWLESSPRGHREWPNSIVFRAVCDNSIGPFVVIDTIGKGHNPEVFRLKDGRLVLYIIDGHYIADKIEGPWTSGKFDFDPRDRRIIEGLSNLTFVRRDDGSFIMVCRGGGVWISQTGLSPYNQITDRRIYPAVEGRFEDPVIWRDHVQYHLIVNDWLGRIAFYQRSKDGIHWVTDPGEAYTPGISRHEDGRIEDWFKYERIKMFQDEYGRAIQANFAVIDTLKPEDRANDNHSSKNISIPLNPGVLLTLLDQKPITPKTATIRVKIAAEQNFNPQTDVDIASLRFGASSEVNYGRGCKALRTENSGADLIVIFDAKGHGIIDDEFAPKLIGRTTSGALLYGYARLPYITYKEPVLSARLPIFTPTAKGFVHDIEVQNFGEVASQKTILTLEYEKDGRMTKIGTATVPALKPYQKTQVKISGGNLFSKGEEYAFVVTLQPKRQKASTLTLKATPIKE
jgi:hypothetical protein